MDIMHGWYSEEANQYAINKWKYNFFRGLVMQRRKKFRYDQNGNKVQVTAIYKSKHRGEEDHGFVDKVYLGLVFETEEEARLYKEITDKILYL